MIIWQNIKEEKAVKQFSIQVSGHYYEKICLEMFSFF